MYMVYTGPVKGMAALHACKAHVHVLHAHYMQCSRSVHAVSMHGTRKCPKMHVITHIFIKSLIIYYTSDCNALFGFSEFADNLMR